MKKEYEFIHKYNKIYMLNDLQGLEKYTKDDIYNKSMNLIKSLIEDAEIKLKSLKVAIGLLRDETQRKIICSMN